MMTMQLIGKDDSSFDDSEILTGRWQTYIDSFVSVGCFYRVSALMSDLDGRAKRQRACLNVI